MKNGFGIFAIFMAIFIGKHVIIFPPKKEKIKSNQKSFMTPTPSSSATSASKLRLAVLGPHFNSSTHLLANYYGGNDLVKSQTPLMGLERRSELDIVGAAEGVPMCGSFCGAGNIPAAVALARKAEVAVLFVGSHSTQGLQSHTQNASADAPGAEALSSLFHFQISL